MSKSTFVVGILAFVCLCPVITHAYDFESYDDDRDVKIDQALDRVAQEHTDFYSPTKSVDSAANEHTGYYDGNRVTDREISVKPKKVFKRQKKSSIVTTTASVKKTPSKQVAEAFNSESVAEKYYAEREGTEDDSVESRPEKMMTRDEPAEEAVGNGANALRARSREVEIALELFDFEYNEPGVMKDTGKLYGLHARYLFRPENSDGLVSELANVFKVEGRFNVGEVDYSSVRTGSLDNERNYALEFRLLAGKEMYYDPSLRFTPYAGFGFQYLNNDGEGRLTTTGHFSYERESRYYYLPFGFDVAKQLSKSWVFGLNLEYDFFLMGKQISHLSESVGYEDLENRQRRGHGWRGSIKFIKENPKLDFLVEPFFRYWHIYDSDIDSAAAPGNTVTIGVEPDNTTTELGVKVGTRF